MSVQIKGSGTIGGIDEGLVVSGIVTATELDISGNIDVHGHTNLDNVNIAGVTTSTGNIYADNYFGNSGLTLNNLLDIKASVGRQLIERGRSLNSNQ